MRSIGSPRALTIKNRKASFNPPEPNQVKTVFTAQHQINDGDVGRFAFGQPPRFIEAPRAGEQIACLFNHHAHQIQRNRVIVNDQDCTFHGVGLLMARSPRLIVRVNPLK